MPRTSMKMLAGVLAAGFVLSACGQSRLGSAVVTQNGRISSERLSSQVSELNKDLKQYGGRVSLQFPESQKPQEVLSWLIRFKVRDELAARFGVKVTPGEAHTALEQLVASVAQNQQSGTTPPFNALAVANGIPINQISDLARYEAIQMVVMTRMNGGATPTAAQVQGALGTKFVTAECRAAKFLDIKVSPQYGRLDYNGYLVVAAPSTLAAAAPGATPSPSPSPSSSAKPQYSPPC